MKVPLPLIYKALKGLPSYLGNLTKRKVKQHRHYIVSGRRQLGVCKIIFPKSKLNFEKSCCIFPGEIDICLLNPYSGYKGLLLLTDAYTKFLWFALIKSKKKEEIFNALKKIIEKSGSFDRIISDGELRFCYSWFHKRNIFYHSVQLSKHPSFVEVSQRTLKQRIYSNLRLNHSKNWPKIIKGLHFLINSFEFIAHC